MTDLQLNMATINFYLIGKNDKRKSVNIRYLDDGQKITLALGEMVDTKYWDARRQCLKASAPGATKFNGMLKAVEQKAIDLRLEAKAKGFQVTKEILKGWLFNEAKTTGPVKLEIAFEKFIVSIAQTHRASTIGVYKTVWRRIEEYADSQKRIFFCHDISAEWIEAFGLFLLSNNINNSTLHKQVRVCKSFLNWAKEKGYVSDGFQKSKSPFKPYAAPKIHLSADEMKRLAELKPREGAENVALPASYNADAPGPLERLRDVFLFACLTGLRYSDVRNLRPENVTDGRLTLVDVKTGDNVYFELSPNALKILQKYEYRLPVISNQKSNEAIKRLCKQAGIDAPIQRVTYKGAERVQVTKPKYELISFHTARATFISLMLGQGAPVHIVQKLVGHNDLKTTMGYVDVTAEEKNAVVARIDRLLD